jgi:hypothetical protein
VNRVEGFSQLSRGPWDRVSGCVTFSRIVAAAVVRDAMGRGPLNPRKTLGRALMATIERGVLDCVLYPMR